MRRNFKPVPYYDPAIQVGEDGKATVNIELPDNLTNFKVRAKAISGAERFGFATGQIAVRLPVIVQPALPRFVRPGDRFTAAAIGRVVEGEGGPGSAEIRVDGVTLEGPAKREVSFVPNQPERIDFSVQVPNPPYTDQGALAYDQVQFTVGVERSSDQAKDAFEVKLPIRDDRQRVTLQDIVDLTAGKPYAWPGVPETPRPGTVRRELLISDQPALLRMAAGLSFLLEYPYGCTEQRVSRARAALALKKFRDLLHLQGSDQELQALVQQVLDWLPLVLDPDGRAAYWPGSKGYVSLTAWVVEFLVEAKAAGFPVDAKLFQGLTRTLEQALRSDYSGFIDGEAYAERTWALAALTEAGKANAAYAAELARKAQFLDLEGLAQVVGTLAQARQTPDTMAPLIQELWKGIVVRLYQGHEVYGGLQERRSTRSGLILPSETRTVALVTRTLAQLGGRGFAAPTADQRARDAGPRRRLGLDEREQRGAAGPCPGAQGTFPRQQRAAGVADPGRREPVARHWPGCTRGELRRHQPHGRSGHVAAGCREERGRRAGRDHLCSAGPGQPGGVPGGRFRRHARAAADQSRGSSARGVSLDAPGKDVKLSMGDVVEEHVQVVNPEDRNYVAVVVPLAAGMEPLNPALATAPPEAKPKGQLTREASYVAFLDDQAVFYYDELPKGTYDFYFRTRASTPGQFIQPAAKAEMMYNESVHGNSPGAEVEVVRGKED